MLMIDVRPTKGERLAILRRRYGQTQHQAAVRWGVPFHRYCDWEAGRRTDLPAIPYFKLTMPERCRLKREHSNMTQREVARLVGRSRLWVNKVEAGLVPSDRLAFFWSER